LSIIILHNIRKVTFFVSLQTVLGKLWALAGRCGSHSCTITL
jgi:hypothetical protein